MELAELAMMLLPRELATPAPAVPATLLLTITVLTSTAVKESLAMDTVTALIAPLLELASHAHVMMATVPLLVAPAAPTPTVAATSTVVLVALASTPWRLPLVTRALASTVLNFRLNVVFALKLTVARIPIVPQ